MADEKTAEENAPAAAPASKKWMVIGIAAGLALGGAGVAFFSGALSEAEASPEEPPEAVEVVNEVFEMQPFVINLGDANELHYLRLGLGFGMFNPDPGSPLIEKEIQLPRLKDYLLTIIGEKGVAELAGPEGREALKQEILKGANEQILGSGEGKILEIYLTEFIVQ